MPYELEGADSVAEGSRPTLSALSVSPDYFRTLGAAAPSGRDFNDADGLAPVVIVNQRLASRLWPDENPLGKRLRLFSGKNPEAWLTVVGVAPNIAQVDATRPERNALAYLPYQRGPAGTMWVIARTQVSPGTLFNSLRREIHAMDSDLPLFGPYTLEERLAGRYWNRGLYGALFLTFAAIALLLASIGLYAVIAHSVSAELVQVSPADPLALAVASAVLILTAALGCLIPARRAMRVDPVVALRHE